MRDDFSKTSIRILAQRVNYLCSNPECRKGTTGPDTESDKSVSIGVAAHITAASEGGPRHDPNLTSEERRHIDNGIWLCQSCSRLIDTDETRYTVELLKGWKAQAEQRALRVLERAMSPRTSTALVLPLPADLPDFTGRQAQIQRVRDLLNQQRIVTITGMGGVGKTALAVHVAHQLVAEGRFPDARLTIDLKGVGTSPVDPVDALDSLINAILEPDPNRPRDLNALSALWRQVIDGKDALLILDNADDVAQVLPLLPGYPTSCAVLVTSEVRFNLSGARRLNLPPMQPTEARDLLQELAPHLDPDEADQIAVLCGRLPQALRIAGYYLSLRDDVTPENYAKKLADERTRLAQLRDDAYPDLDVYATISLSVDELDADTRRAWALLSLFRAPFNLPAAAALWDQPEDQARDQLQALRDRSLVTYDPDATRYHQHDLVRLAAARDLDALTKEESHAAYLRFACHYEQVARQANRLYKEGGDNVLQALALFDLEWPHIQAGQAWAAARADHDGEAARLCSDYTGAATDLLDLRLHPRNRIAWRESALRAARRLGDRHDEGANLNGLGLAYADLGETHKAIDYYQQALEIAREIGDRRGEGATLGNLGSAYDELGETQQAIEHHTAALEIVREIGDRRGEGAHLGNLGSAYYLLGETHKAIEHHTAALEISKEIGDRRGEGTDLGNLGLAYADLGETHQAIEQYQQALEISREIGDRRGEGTRLGNLGLAYADLGEMNQAIEQYTVALEIAREIGDRRVEGAILGNLGLAYADLGEMHQAIDYLHRALRLQETIDDPVGVASTCYNLACGYALQRDPEHALPYLRRALALNSDEYCHLTADDTDFDAIRDDPSFQALLEEFCLS